MFEQLAFYFKHSLNDLRVNGQRTFFAILAVAAGVAAIVSLQTVAVLIEDALTGDLQAQNRGDLQISPPLVLDPNDDAEFIPEDIVIFEQEELERAIEDGFLTRLTSSSPFGDDTEVYYTADGIAAIQAWLDENYPGQAEVNYRVQITSGLAVFSGSGDGTVIQQVDGDEQASSIVPFVIDADVYPFYTTIETLEGESLATALSEANNIVLSRTVMAELNAEIGDRVRLRGASEDFVVSGIVADETGAAEPGEGIGIFGAILGFYYIDESALQFFEERAVSADRVFIRLDDPTLVNEVETELAESLSFIGTTITTDDLLEQNQEFAENLDLMLTIMGLLSLLIGSIGIVNTMQVVVRRRTIEIAVLKTVGLQAGQVTYLFLTEAFIMGVLGSIFGVLLGWGATFIIKEAATIFAAQELAFKIVPSAVLNGVIVGTLVTTVFGFLPTLSAGQVRPGIVLRPSDSVIPRAGFIRNFLALIFIVIALGIITQGILNGQVGLAFAIVGGAFVTAGVLFVLLLFVIWLVGRILPSFGVVDFKISLRQMLVTRGRGAITLLALVVGIFALSVITMFTEAFTNLLDFAIDEGSRGNVIVFASQATINPITGELDNLDVVNSYWVDRSYNLTFLSIEKPDGETVAAESLQAQLYNTLEAGSSPSGGVEELTQQLNTVAAITDDQIEEEILVAGRQLTPDDEGLPYIVIRNSPELEAAGIQVGDKLNFEYQGGLFNFGADSIQLEVIGITEAPDTGGISFDDGFGSNNLALISAFPESRPPDSYSVQVDIPEENVPDLKRAVSDIPGAIVFELDLLVNFIRAFVEQFRAFPTLVAALGLVVGGIVIANSVALSTMERRREIAIMKSIGLQRERVLGMLLFENVVLGFIGGLFGVGLGLLALYILTLTAEFPTDTIPIGTGLLLMALCVIVALVAAITTAWGASGEKPLNVLRYE